MQYLRPLYDHSRCQYQIILKTIRYYIIKSLFFFIKKNGKQNIDVVYIVTKKKIK